ncbi:hypothetical protein RF11_07979 [Thelohanellus kitauei]|uniref:Peptidase A2 domain-containing protein n=1 Tax=Thelohanellus kitauei TaxID=669202 RepID=A0A0C2N2Z2_THEKT|nr:hypothetical protein RF11_07979 [Thelohanellus kitauei]
MDFGDAQAIFEMTQEKEDEPLNAELMSPSKGMRRANNMRCTCERRRFSTTFVQGLLGRSVRVSLLIDSGCCNTLINVKTWQQIVFRDQMSRKVTESTLRFKSSNGNPLECIGRTNVLLSLGNTSLWHPVHIINSDCHSFIMGIDLMKRLKAKVNYAKEIFTVRGIPHPLLSVITHSKPHCRTQKLAPHFI